MEEVLEQLPARHFVEQAAWVLNFQPHDVRVVETEGAFVYSNPIAMPEIGNTDFLFGVKP